MRGALVLSIGIALAGCGGISVRFRPTAGPSRAPIAPARVAVYTMPPPGVRYDVVGYFHARESALDLEPGPALLAAIRDEAARRGCTSVIVDHGYCAEEDGSRVLGSRSILDAACIEVRR